MSRIAPCRNSAGPSMASANIGRLVEPSGRPIVRPGAGREVIDDGSREQADDREARPGSRDDARAAANASTSTPMRRRPKTMSIGAIAT